jgi:hypothetical protein
MNKCRALLLLHAVPAILANGIVYSVSPPRAAAVALKDAARMLGTTVNIKRHGQFDEQFGEVVCGLRLPLLRYPGGGESQWWDWRKGWVITEQEYIERFPENTTIYPETSMARSYVRGNTSYTLHNLKKFFVDVCNRTQDFVPRINFVLNIVSGELQDQLDFLAAAKALAIEIEAVELGDEFHSPNRANVDRKFPNGTFFASYAAEWARAIKLQFPGVSVMVPARRQDATADPPGTRQALWTQQLLAGLKIEDRGAQVGTMAYSPVYTTVYYTTAHHTIQYTILQYTILQYTILQYTMLYSTLYYSSHTILVHYTCIAQGVDSVCMHPYWTAGCGKPGYSRTGFWGNLSVQQQQLVALGTFEGVGSALANAVSTQENDVLGYIRNFSAGVGGGGGGGGGVGAGAGGDGLGFEGLSLRVTEMNVQDYSGPLKFTWVHALQVGISYCTHYGYTHCRWV